MFLFDYMVLEVLQNGPQNGLHFDANIFQDLFCVCYVIFGVGGTPKGLHLDAYYYVLNIPQYDLIAFLF